MAMLPFGDQYASFIREHKILRYYTNPATSLYSIGKFITSVIKTATPEGFITVAASAEMTKIGPERELIIVVVGETARADHFSLNGYPRETNPGLAGKDNLVSFTQITSCGTDTAISVPCLFYFDGRSDFDAGAASHTENVLDLLARAGVNILWRDNNTGSKGVADRVRYEDFVTLV